MILTIRHFPDRKRPAIVLEEDTQCLVIGYLTDHKRERWLRKAWNNRIDAIKLLDAPSIDELTKEVE